MRKIVYVSPVPLSDRIKRDWHVADLIAAGATVEYWDGSGLWGYRGGAREASPDGVAARIDVFSDLRRRILLPENRDAIFVLLMNYEARYHNLFRLLTRLGRTICMFEWGHIPLAPASKTRKLASLARDPFALCRAVYRKALTGFSRRLGLIKPFDLVFAAGESAAHRHANAGRVVPINMCDYENFRLAARDPKRLIRERYCLFLDSNHPMNPDRGFLGIPLIDPDRYFALLNRFFDLIETKFDFPVAVALHPKSSYGSERFGGRRTMSDSTPALVKDAELVICHSSTSMGYAVLAAKPILYVYTEDMARALPEYLGDMRAQSDYLRMPVFNLDRASSADGLAMPAVDPERYNRYKYDFLASRRSEAACTKDVILGEFRRLSAESPL